MDNEPQGPRKPAGRPPASEPSIRVSTWIKQREFDRLAKIASQRDDRSVSAAVADILRRRLG